MRNGSPGRAWTHALRLLVTVFGVGLLTWSVGPVALAANPATPGWVTDPASLVNPLIGTSPSCDRASCDGLDVPGAYLPFGMMQWGPITSSGGYSYADTSILGYAMTSVSGCGGGCAAASNVPVLPTVGAVGTDPSAATEPMDHGQETATPGDYRLSAGGVATDLTDTTRAGIASFTFPASSSANLLLQLAHNNPTATDFQVVGDDRVEGSITRSFSNPAGAPDPTPSYSMYFDMEFNRPFASSGTWNQGSAPVTQAASAGDQPAVSGAAGALVTFDTTSDQKVLARVGISYVSTADAAQNLHTEIPGWDVASVATAAHQAWNAMLGRIQIAGGTPAEQATFYTALYHSLLFPNVFSDVNGEYWGWDGRVHTVAAGHAAYANFSGWDVYRSQIQLAAMLAPDRMSDMVSSILADYAQTGQLTQWSANDMERYVMIGDPADPIITDAYAFGARDFDTATALRDMAAQATQPGVMRPGLEQYEKLGYVAYDGGPYSCCGFRGVVSAQLEYDTDDNAIAELAQGLGDQGQAATFATRAQNWQNSLDPASGYFEPKSVNGVFRSANSPDVPYGASGYFDTDSTAFFADGDRYVYTPMVPFDLGGLIAAEGGDAAWNAYLDGLTANVTDMGATHIEMTNEPSTEIAWEYDYSGEPYRTQEVARQIEDDLYTDTPGGLPGNDDQGELSSWYVWAAMGLYPETPGSADLALGSPLFPAVAIHTGTGRTVVEHAPAATDAAPYVQGLTVDGARSDRAYLPAASVVGQGTTTLDWSLGTAPDTGWASGAGEAPPSATDGLLPALGYLGSGETGETVFLRPGTGTALDLGVQGMGAAGTQVDWTASAPVGSGLTLSPAAGRLDAAGETRSTAHVTLAATQSPAHGEYAVTFHLRTQSGVTLPDVVAEVGVDPVFDATGISSDTAQSAADFDGTGYSYSEQALTAAGLAPGATVTSDGITYTWPDVAAGTPDNTVAAGQTIALQVPSGATRLGFLGAASDGPLGGSATVTYTDGTTQTVTLELGDWVSGGATGESVVATLPYRNWATQTSQSTATHVYAVTVPLEAGRTVSSVTLPAASAQGALHLFALGSDAGQVSMI